MKFSKLALGVGVCSALLATSFAQASSEKLIIAHRGASGYLPEHTLESKALAFGQHTDFPDTGVEFLKKQK